MKRALPVLGLTLGLLALLAIVLALRVWSPAPPQRSGVTAAPPPDQGTLPEPATPAPASPSSPPTPGAAPPEPAPGLAADTAEPSVLPEVQLGLGAEAFGRGDMEAARGHFRAIVDEAPDHPMAPYAAYKLAWSEANLGEHRKAITEMQRVITWLRDEGRPEEAVTLREALMDLEHFQGQLDTGG